jgi:uncharacterized protein (TIGR02145 family)
MKQLINICAGAVLLMPIWGCSEKPEVNPEATYYSISFTQTTHGSAVATLNGEVLTEAMAGTTILLSAIPANESRKFESWSITPQEVIPSAYNMPRTTFVMPAQDVVITPLFVDAGFISEGGRFGEVTFYSAQQWEVGNLVWSDMVMASLCKKDEFNGGPAGPYNVDCRQSEGFGDLFTWEAVDQFAGELCPEGWRIPTKRDFFDLDVALGGSGTGGVNAKEYTTVWRKYLDEWGAQPSGYARTANPDVIFPGAVACYWSQTELNDDRANYLYVYSGRIYPQYSETKDLGMSVRCVTERLWARK